MLLTRQPGAAVLGGSTSLPSLRKGARNSERGIPSTVPCWALLLHSTKEPRSRGGLPSLRNPTFPVLPAPLSLADCGTQKRRRERGSLSCRAALGLEITPTTVIVLSSVLGFAALRAYVYFRMETRAQSPWMLLLDGTIGLQPGGQYIIAAMLGRHVPRGGAKVVELNIRGGRNLYYYPPDIVQVVAVSSKPNKELLENQAIRAGVPIQISTKGPSALDLPSNSVDAVVSVSCFRDMPDRMVAGVLREAVRVLKPGKPFLFVENVKAKNAVVRSMKGIIEALSSLVGSKRALQHDLLPYIQEVQGFEDVDYEEVFSLIDPHLVGLAKKKLSIASEPNKEARKGFKKSKA